MESIYSWLDSIETNPIDEQTKHLERRQKLIHGITSSNR